MEKINQDQPTVDEIEQKYNIKITYPETRLDGVWTDEQINEIRRCGCFDLWYREKGIHEEGGEYPYGISWYHQDCWGYENGCENCNYKEHRDKYYKDNGLDPYMEPDLAKVGFMLGDVKQSKSVWNWFKKTFKK